MNKQTKSKKQSKTSTHKVSIMYHVAVGINCLMHGTVSKIYININII